MARKISIPDPRRRQPVIGDTRTAFWNRIRQEHTGPIGNEEAVMHAEFLRRVRTWNRKEQ